MCSRGHMMQPCGQLRHRLHLNLLRPPSPPLASTASKPHALSGYLYRQAAGRSTLHWRACSYCLHLASRLLTVSMSATRPRCFPADISGIPSCLLGLFSNRRACRASGPTQPAPLTRGGQQRETRRRSGRVCSSGTQQSCRARRKLTLGRRRSCRRPGPVHRSCRSPPLLLLVCWRRRSYTSHTQRV